MLILFPISESVIPKVVVEAFSTVLIDVANHHSKPVPERAVGDLRRGDRHLSVHSHVSYLESRLVPSFAVVPPQMIPFIELWTAGAGSGLGSRNSWAS